MSNAALFTTVAREYANFRPGYPPELFEWLARVSPKREAAWDAGCGSGQASVALAEHFATVHATDVAAEQIAAAKPHPRIRYAVAPAETSGLADGSVDLVTVAQALHWFDVEAFYAEARRVARPEALLVVWNYPRPVFDAPALDAVFQDFYANVVGPYWPAGRKHVEANYTTLPFPQPELTAPRFSLDLDWSPAQVIGYVSSWSATARYREARGADPVPLFAQALRKVWRDDTAARLRMPLGMRVAKIGGARSAL
jgi:SAM-dependent methyltransferase